jgi:hypothetical protein
VEFDRIYEQLVVELFNTKQAADWDYTDGTYNAFLEGPQGASYHLSLAPFWDTALEPEFYNIKEITPEAWNVLQEGAWHVEFVSNADDGTTRITGDQGAQASKVFGIIGNALLEKVQANPKEFRSLVFQAKEPSRRSLYSRLAPILAKKLGKDLIISADQEWFLVLAKD